MENISYENAGSIANISGVDGDYSESASLHLRDLRKRFTRIFFAMFIFGTMIYFFSESILQYSWNTFLDESIGMNVYSPLEWVFAKLKVSFLLAFTFTFPFFFYEMFRFASRGLYPNERKFVKSIVPVSLLFFFLGVAVSLIFIMPLMFDYIILSSDNIADNQISVKQTISMAVTLMAGSGLVFQVPFLMFFATRMGIISREILRKMRILIYVGFMTFALFLSPDPTFIAQLICAALLVILFEIGLLFSK